MSTCRISFNNRRAQLPKVDTTNKRSRWTCEQCKRQFCGVKPCPFCYRTITAEETTESESL